MKQALLALTAIIIVIAGCAPDTVFDFTTELEGTYHGTYKVIKGYNTSTPATDDDPIDWVFAGEKFWCYFKPPTGETPLCCDFFGYFDYQATNLNLKDTTVIGQCNHSYVAVGEFSQNYAQDTLTLVKDYPTYNPALRIVIQLVSDSVTSE